jgi:hypothetical protein
MKLEPKLRTQARDIFRAALKAADPVDSVVRTLRRDKYERYRHIYVIGAGKAGASMAKGAERVGQTHHRRTDQRQGWLHRKTAAHRAERGAAIRFRRTRRGRRTPYCRDCAAGGRTTWCLPHLWRRIGP